MTRILKLVLLMRSFLGSTIKVRLSSAVEGLADILKHVLKLSEDNWIVPEQELLNLLVVMLFLSICLLNVTETDVLTPMRIELSAGCTE